MIVRLLTWNVRDMLGDPLAVHRVMNAARADVVCLQESPRWPGSRLRLRRIARATGLTFVAGGRASAGTAVLIGDGVRLVSAQALRLPVRGWLTRPRGVVLVSVGVTSHPSLPPLSVACLHLGLDRDERRQHLELIRQRVAGHSHLVLAGDLNEAPGGQTWATLTGLARDPFPDAGPTFPSWTPRHRIDAVLASADIEVLDYDRWRPDPRDLRLSSDHRPVLAVLKVLTTESQLGTS